MNATLQSLSSIRELTQYFLEKYIENKDKKMSIQYYTVIRNLWDIKNHCKSYSPFSFIKVLGELNPILAEITANDSKDLIIFMLEQLHEELNLVGDNNFDTNLIRNENQFDESKTITEFVHHFEKRYNSIISNLFYGITETNSQCCVYKKIKYDFKSFSWLEFNLKKINDFCFKNNLRKDYKGQGNPDIDLYECFYHYQNAITLKDNNQKYCDNCGKLTDLLNVKYFFSLPYYLIIILERGKDEQYKCNVKIPNILNLNNYLKYRTINSIFQLKAVISNIRPSSILKKYLAYCRHYKDNNWYKYNDSFVTKCHSKKEYLNGLPRILFYESLDKELN